MTASKLAIWIFDVEVEGNSLYDLEYWWPAQVIMTHLQIVADMALTHS